MHEYSLVGALTRKVEQEARARGATAVLAVHVRVGELAGVDPSLLASAFELSREGLLKDASLEVETTPAAWACPRCGGAPGPGEALRCRACGLPARLVGGDELLLERIELEVE